MSSESEPRQMRLPISGSDSSVYDALKIPQPVLKPTEASRPQDQIVGGYTPKERAELEKIEPGGRRDIDG